MPAHTLVRTEWIGPSSWAGWVGSHTYALHAYVIPTAPHLNGYYYKATSVSGNSGPIEPTWPTGVGSTVVDGGVTWTRQYTTALLGSELAALDASIAGLVSGGGGGGPAWTFNTVHAVDDFVVPTTGNGFYYLCTAIAFDHKSSPVSEPTWPTTIGATVVDYHVTWTCMGPTEAGGGGSWAPTSPIVIGGQGLGLDKGIGLVLCRGGSLTLANTGGIAFDALDYWNYGPTHSGRTRVLQYSCALGRGWPDFCWRARFGDGGMQAVCGLIDLSDGNGPQPVTLKVPLRSHNGATLTQVKVCWRIGFPHQQVPSVLPSFRVVRVDAGGNVTPMTSVAAGADANGYVSATSPASVAAWTGNQSQTITVDTDNVIDLTQYAYYVEIIEEQTPGGYPWSLVAKAPVKASFIETNPVTGFVGTPADGVSLSNGDRFLVMTGQALYGFMSGIYVWGTGPNGCQRASDLQQPSDFSQGMIVPVNQGSDRGGSYWQNVSTQTSWGGGGSAPTASAFVWTPNIGYSNATPYVESFILPTVPNGLVYGNVASYGDTKTLVGGPTEPSWPTILGATVVDCTTWIAGLVVAAYGPPGTQVVPSVSNGFCYENQGGSGTTSGSEPNWSTALTVGSTVTNGTDGITWTNIGPPLELTCLGTTGDFLTFVPRPQLIDESHGTAGTGFFAHGNIYDAIVATYTGIASGAFQ